MWLYFQSGITRLSPIILTPGIGIFSNMSPTSSIINGKGSHAVFPIICNICYTSSSSSLTASIVGGLKSSRHRQHLSGWSVGGVSQVFQHFLFIHPLVLFDRHLLCRPRLGPPLTVIVLLRLLCRVTWLNRRLIEVNNMGKWVCLSLPGTESY